MKLMLNSAMMVMALTLLSGCQITTTTAINSKLEATHPSRNAAMQAYARGDYHIAAGILEKLAQPPALDPQAPCFLGAIHYRRHEYQAALRRFTQCTESFPERSEFWFNAAASHLRLASELLLNGRSYQHASDASVPLPQAYDELLKALLHLQRAQLRGIN